MRIAFFVGSFPEISETFILRQITGMIDLGHEVDIYSECRSTKTATVHPEVLSYDLINKTTYMNDLIPKASGYWQMPVWPVSGETWLPGSEMSLPNRKRIDEAIPHLKRCLDKVPHLVFEALDCEEWGVEARSLSALYRLSVLSSVEKKYDIIHAHFGPVGNVYRFAKELWNAPLIVTFHGYDFSSIPLQQGLDFYRNLFGVVDVITVNSQYAGNRVVELGCPIGKIHQLNVGMNIHDFSYKERILNKVEIVRILTVGRLVEKKGIEYSIRAVAKVKERYPALRYDIIGEGPLRLYLQELILELNLEEVVILHGLQDSNYVQQMMQQAHVFVLASITSSTGDQEGTPVSLMEAQASGLPIVSTFHSGIPEIVLNGITGFLVAERDVEALSDRISYLITHPDIWQQMGRHGRSHVEACFDICQLNLELVQLYEKAIRHQFEIHALP